MSTEEQRREYKPDLRMRLAMERAAKHQPPLIAITSKVPANYSAALDRTKAGDER